MPSGDPPVCKHGYTFGFCAECVQLACSERGIVFMPDLPAVLGASEPPVEPDPVPQDFYEAEAWCANCQYVGPVRAPVGTPVNGVKCPVCQTTRMSPACSERAQSAQWMMLEIQRRREDNE